MVSVVYSLEGAQPVAVQERPAGPCVEVLTLAQFLASERAQSVHPRTLDGCRHIRQTKLEAYSDYLFGSLSIPERTRLQQGRHRIAFYMNRDSFLLIGQTEAEYEFVVALLGNLSMRFECSLPNVICSFFSALLAGDDEFVETLESDVLAMEERALSGEYESFNKELLVLHKTLLAFATFYERMFDLAEMLSANEFGFFEAQHLRFLRRYGSAADRLQTSMRVLLEQSMGVQQIYQSEANLRLNNTMNVLTVVTTIFLPLGLLTSWYGMNFKHMRELDWIYGYPLVIGLSLLLALASAVYFKRKKYF